MTYRVYSRDFKGGVTATFTGETRWECEKYLRNLRRAGRVTHFYVISTLDQRRAMRRYSTDR